ncbi:hypothetical protein F5888DRAFT_942984 [Russula emetica]|nr:hypothetical protein F5888DRAFT_942984 [Russula emetica]
MVFGLPLIVPMARSVSSMALPIPLPPHHTTSPSPPADMNYGSESSAAGLNDYDYPDPYGQPDTDLDHDVYGADAGWYRRSWISSRTKR